MEHLNNSARLYYNIAAHVQQEAERGNHDAVRRLCHDQLADPRLPLFYRAAFCQILAEDGQEPLRIHFAEQAVAHFQMIAQQIPPSEHLARLYQKALSVLNKNRRERQRELNPPPPRPPKIGGFKGPKELREQQAARAAWYKEQKEEQARKDSDKTADHSTNIAPKIEQTETRAITHDIVDLKDLLDFASKLIDENQENTVVRTTVTKTSHSKISEKDDANKRVSLGLKSTSEEVQTGASADTDADEPLTMPTVSKHKGRKSSEVYMHRNAEDQLIGNESAMASGATESNAAVPSATVFNDQTGASTERADE